MAQFDTNYLVSVTDDESHETAMAANQPAQGSFLNRLPPQIEEVSEKQRETK